MSSGTGRSNALPHTEYSTGKGVVYMKVLRFDRYLGCLAIAIFMIGLNSCIDAEQAHFLSDNFPDGFKRQGDVRYYNPGNLYEYINGQAVFYISYGFKNLEHGTYHNDGKEYTVDVYELKSRLSSFGAYRQQRDDDSAGLNAGVEGSVIDYLATFYKDNYYIETNIIILKNRKKIIERKRSI